MASLLEELNACCPQSALSGELAACTVPQSLMEALLAAAHQDGHLTNERPLQSEGGDQKCKRIRFPPNTHHAIFFPFLKNRVFSNRFTSCFDSATA